MTRSRASTPRAVGSPSTAARKRPGRRRSPTTRWCCRRSSRSVPSDAACRCARGPPCRATCARRSRRCRRRACRLPSGRSKPHPLRVLVNVGRRLATVGVDHPVGALVLEEDRHHPGTSARSGTERAPGYRVRDRPAGRIPLDRWPCRPSPSAPRPKAVNGGSFPYATARFGVYVPFHKPLRSGTDACAERAYPSQRVEACPDRGCQWRTRQRR